MKKLYSVILGSVMLCSIQAFAQCSVSISPSADTVCAGQTVGLTASVQGPGSALTTTMAAGNNHRGNMFTIHALNAVTITSFDAHPMGNTTIEIYYRTGTYVGFESSSAGWTFVGSAAVIAQPMGTPTPVPVQVNVTIPAGQSYSFYVTSSNQAVSLNYTDGSSEGAVYTSDANIEFLQGVGMEYPFTNGSNSVFRPRLWNGVIHYAVQGTPSYLWNTAATTASITETATSSMSYDVTVTVAGCGTLYDTAMVFVPTPMVAASNDTTVCAGSAVTLNATGNLTSYNWDNSVTNNVPFTPAATAAYIVTGTDVYGCAASDTVDITVNSLPAVFAGNDTMVCYESMLTLSGSGAVSYTWTNGITDGVPFLVVAPGLYTVTGTDINGCVNTDDVFLSTRTVSTNVTVVNETMTVDSAASYQWIDCNTLQPIPGATGQSYTATVNGSYAVIVSDGVCSDTSACQLILSTGLSGQTTGVVSLFPNPTDGAFTLSTGNVAAGIVITDLTGRVLNSFAPQNAILPISLVNEESGIYFVTVIGKDNSLSTVKVVKH